MSDIQDTLEKAIEYFEDIIDNPDEVIKIKPSPEDAYMKKVIELIQWRA